MKFASPSLSVVYMASKPLLGICCEEMKTIIQRKKTHSEYCISLILKGWYWVSRSRGCYHCSKDFVYISLFVNLVCTVKRKVFCKTGFIDKVYEIEVDPAGGEVSKRAASYDYQEV